MIELVIERRLFGERQADAGAFDVGGFGSQPVEGREDAVVQILGDADALVDDADAQAIGAAEGGDRDRAAGVGIFDRVRNEIGQHLMQQLTICPN